MAHTDRYNQLLKLAKKPESFSTLRGKISKKDIQKHLDKVKKIYEVKISEYRQAKDQLEKLTEIVNNTGELAKEARQEMAKIYKVIQNLDLSNASEVKFDKSGKDVFYMRSGKLYTFEEESGDLLPYKRTKPSGEEFTEDELLSDDLSTEEEFDEGFDVTRP